MDTNPNRKKILPPAKNAAIDHKLVMLVKNGDEGAFKQLMEKHRRSVFYMMLKMVQNNDDAEDLTQEAFLKAYSSIDKYNPTFAFSTWLYKIANYNCIDFIRKKRLKTTSIDQSSNSDEGESRKVDIKDSGKGTDDKLEKEERKKFLVMAMDRLDERFQTLIKLRYFEELSYEEISQQTEMSLGTVKAQLHRGRQLLKEYLEHFIRDEDDAGN